MADRKPDVATAIEQSIINGATKGAAQIIVAAQRVGGQNAGVNAAIMGLLMGAAAVQRLSLDVGKEDHWMAACRLAWEQSATVNIVFPRAEGHG